MIRPGRKCLAAVAVLAGVMAAIVVYVYGGTSSG